ncbi:MAG: hypothetical protein IJX40_03040 [Alistipes sp.]|nr:hypothetical protein [Alistipes sp.]
MTTQEQYIERLKEIVRAKHGREICTAEDCALLAEALREATKQSIDPRALELMFLAKRRSFAPRPSVLTALAMYVGYGSWSDFCSSRDVLPADDTDIIPVKRRWGVIILTIAAIVIVLSAILYLLLGDNTAVSNTENIALQRLYTDVDERWRAIATEECNDLRSAGDMSASEVNSIITERIITLGDSIATDIEATATQRGMAIDEATLSEYADKIAERCESIYQCALN